MIWDIGTSAIIHAQATLHGRLGTQLPEGVAFDGNGDPTRDPEAALMGAFAAWGGHRGSGLGVVVQLLGMLAGSQPLPPDLAEFGFLIVAIDPGLLTSTERFKADVADYAGCVRSSRPVRGGPPVRMPFDRSRKERKRRLAADVIDVPDTIYASLRDFVKAASP